VVQLLMLLAGLFI